ncbi:MAG: DUF2203 domain-containing protein [Candidatus Rokubacteria bacterium]|nr:DUF2203 domain-containing protein [Candidatus Rokubacteria bacterium]
MAERHFTPAEVEALIGTLTKLMGGVMAAHAEAGEVRERLRAEHQRITMAGGGVIDQAAWRADTELLTQLTQRVQRGLEKIVELGGAPKDLGLGLVDFPHLRQGEEVNLCWKYGESSIRYWHGLDEGYASRKPL